MPIVAMSGGGWVYRGPEEGLRVARLMGADAVLPKPFSRQDLLGASAEALAAGGESSSARAV